MSAVAQRIHDLVQRMGRRRDERRATRGERAVRRAEANAHRRSLQRVEGSDKFLGGGGG
jgi:hypothetical protein